MLRKSGESAEHTMIHSQVSTTLGEATLADFRASLRGALITPADATYDTARRVWNGAIDKRPMLIARCAGVADVIAAVQFARSHGLLVAVRGGSHNVAGNATCDGGLVIDLSPMKGIRVDPARMTARAEGGVLWGELDHETQAFQLATTGGLISTTGIAGFTLGGGIGWLMRAYGLACDNLLSVDIVTAQGQLLTASESEHAELFWGVRGGGGNFGIVTSFEFRLHPVRTILGGVVFYSSEQARDALRFFREFCAAAPAELTLLAELFTAPPDEYIPERYHGARMLAIGACYCEPVAQGEEILRPLRAFGPPVVDLLGPMPYNTLQTMFDAEYPAGMSHYWRSAYLRDLSDDVIDALLAHDAQAPTAHAQIHVHQMGAAVSQTPLGGSAFGHRNAPYLVNELATWTEPHEAEQSIAWVRELSTTLQPHSVGAYVNFLGNEGAMGVQTAYDAATYERLAALKSRYDPTNLFRLNQNIPPQQ